MCLTRRAWALHAIRREGLMHALEGFNSLGHQALDESQLERCEVQVIPRDTDPALLAVGAQVEFVSRG